jgi:NOL1/NOP2/fmu family ribosome biogenesis protein
LLFYLESRFGIDSAVFNDFLLLKRNKSWWFLRQSAFIGYASLLKVSSVGIKAFQMVGKYIKPTTRIIQIFGHHSLRAVLELSQSDINKIIEGRHIFADMKIDNGYIILSYRGAILGLGLYIDGRISSQMPRRDIISILAPVI